MSNFARRINMQNHKQKTDFSKLVDKEILAICNGDNELMIFVEGNPQLEFNSNTCAWRFIEENDILLSSADFYIPIYNTDDHPFSPAYINSDYKTDSFEKHYFFENLEEYFIDAEKHANKRFKAIQDRVEGATILGALENDLGDLTLTLSNGIIFSVFKTLIRD